MQLRPISTPPSPPYPSRHRVFRAIGSWARRAAGVAIASSALALGGCYGATPFADRDEPEDPRDPTTPGTIIDQEPPGPFDGPVVREAGVMAAPSFTCSATPLDPPEWLDGWGYWDGPLCGEETGWAWHEVLEPGRYQLGIDYGAEHVSLTLLDPAGAEVAVLDGATPMIEIELGPGIHTLAASAMDPEGHPDEWFSVSLYPTGY